MNQVVLNQNQSSPRPSLVPKLIAWLIAVGLILAVALNWQWITDQFTAWRYQPPAEIVALAEKSSLNDTGKLYLFASRAEVNERADFNQACGSLQNEKTVVMGCYTGRFGKIHIYDVTDERLNGIKETTTAHEMLHAAFDRLSPEDKRRVGDLLLAEKAKITEERLKKVIAHYEESEPGQIINELHSIIGTEVRQISPELETYYKRYFNDRLVVVSLKEKYEKVFSDLADHQAALVKEMNALADNISYRYEIYQQNLAVLNGDIRDFSAWARSDEATRVEYDLRRAALQGRISAVEAERLAINAQVDRHNQLKVELDALNMQADDLNHSIDSKLEPAPTL